MNKPSDADWRKRPRKPKHEVLSKRISLRLQERDFDAIHDAARNAGMTLTDYIVARALSPDDD